MAFSVEFLHVIREDEILRIAQRLPAGGEILEVGGGTGFQARRLSEEGFHVRSIDVAASQYRGGRVFPVEDYDGVRFPFGDRTFDAVFSSNTIEHLPDPASFHAECFRVLKDGGKCVHAVPTAVWRVATSVAHYADLLRRIAEVPSRRGEGFLRRLRAAAGILRGGILPSRHGESGNFLAEAWTFSRSGWRRHFRRYGLEVVRAEPLGLFYTGYMVRGATWPLAARRRLARWIGSSCALYEVRKCFPIAPASFPGSQR